MSIGRRVAVHDLVRRDEREVAFGGLVDLAPHLLEVLQAHVGGVGVAHACVEINQ